MVRGLGLEFRWQVCLGALACTAAGMAAAAETAIEELDEVVVEGDRVKPRPRSFNELQKPIDWMARLVGEFDIGGSVVISMAGDREESRDVSGHANCVGFGLGPGVQCELQVTWPVSAGPDGMEVRGGISRFDPAVLLLGYEPVQGSVNYILVDNQGFAETAVGEMSSADTMRSRTDCALDAIAAGTCDQVLRITADPDLRTIAVRIEQRIDLAPAVRYNFVLNRVPGSKAVVYGRKQERKK